MYNKLFVEQGEISSICVTAYKVWYGVLQYNKCRPLDYRLDIPAGEGLTLSAIKEAPDRFLRLRDGESSSMSFVEKEIKCAVVTYADGSQDIRDLSLCDQDLPVGMSLEIDLCHTSYYKAFVGDEPIYYKKVKVLHYSGLNYVDKWTIVSEKPFLEEYSREGINDIRLIPGNYGLDALINFVDGRQTSFCTDYRSRDINNGEIISPDDCIIVKKRKYHTLLMDFILVK